MMRVISAPAILCAVPLLVLGEWMFLWSIRHRSQAAAAASASMRRDTPDACRIGTQPRACILLSAYLPVVGQSQSLQLPTDAILYIFRQGRKLLVVSEGARHDFYGKMSDVIPYLDERFFACLQGLVLNLAMIDHLEAQQVFFRSGLSLMLAAGPYRRTRQAYNDYIRAHGA